MASRREQIKNILSDLKKGFVEDYGIGKEDTTRMYYRQRDLENAADDAPAFTNMVNTHPGIFRAREALQKISPEAAQALQESNMNLRGSTAHKIGQIGGSLAADVTQDRSRSIYWLLNALQATGEVINESALARAVPSLYKTSPVINPNVKKLVDGKKVDKPLQLGNEADMEYMVKNKMIVDQDGKYVPGRGYKFKPGEEGGTELHQRNYSQGMLASLAIPTGIAINSGLGLLTPFGGAEGYKAALPTAEDPTKTENVLGEVALKYVMGRTGNLLPYDEFVKVRPDVSRDEYNAYQAFKFNKNEDYDITDGDLTIGAGALKLASDGIHGPEVQFLGRSLPVTTGVVPYLSALAGGVAGARAGARSQRAAMGGLGGGTAGLVVGQVAGNIIEQERRRRNASENELTKNSAEMYLGYN